MKVLAPLLFLACSCNAAVTNLFTYTTNWITTTNWVQAPTKQVHVVSKKAVITTNTQSLAVITGDATAAELEEIRVAVRGLKEIDTDIVRIHSGIVGTSRAALVHTKWFFIKLSKESGGQWVTESWGRYEN